MFIYTTGSIVWNVEKLPKNFKMNGDWIMIDDFQTRSEVSWYDSNTKNWRSYRRIKTICITGLKCHCASQVTSKTSSNNPFFLLAYFLWVFLQHASYTKILNTVDPVEGEEMCCEYFEFYYSVSWILIKKLTSLL